ncbi:hypothetical protein psal_cds_647 [Pandoravirus salinus]|uniref:Uncharacterized protein n=1 Tax=Pandoravirus salinus TaxID=1349410 RepID=S4W280_9VIRU|nr:hypothetical protein psal_cds_647 [Pandoravirus salinus]AGO84547.1 hypothetical protein psal_cds_647 [Pandoravirus salinus]
MPTTTAHSDSPFENAIVAHIGSSDDVDDNSSACFYHSDSKDVFMGHSDHDAVRDEFLRGSIDAGHAQEARACEMLDAASVDSTAPHPLDALATVITREGLPEGAQEEAPAWVAALERFASAMETFVQMRACHLFPSWRESGKRLCIDNPADARRLVADLYALARRTDDADDFYSSLALAHAIDTAARDAATAAIVGMETVLIEQAGAVNRLREGARAAERCVHEAFASVATAAARGPAGPTRHEHVTISIVMQAIRGTLETGGVLHGPALARSFYSAIVEGASAFGPSQPPRLVETSSAGFDALQRMRASPHVGRILQVLSARNLGVPLFGPHPRAYPKENKFSLFP